jgi:predicted glycoside hydrolase/deacetylase ChbG (UPF0249 family)
MFTGRHLIVNADDFGLSAGVNRGVVAAHDNGIVTSASLMVHMPAAAEAAALARTRPLLSVGLHIDIGEWRYERGRWIPVYERAPQSDPLALEAAVVDQVELFRCLTGAVPTHLDSHQHVHNREPLRSIISGLATQLDVPVRHSGRKLLYRGEFYGQNEKGQLLPEHLTASFLVSIIETLSEGVTELSCHPALKLDFQSPYRRERLEELKALCSPVVIEALKRERVSLASFLSVRPFLS